jgi:hypothetical protein
LRVLLRRVLLLLWIRLLSVRLLLSGRRRRLWLLVTTGAEQARSDHDPESCAVSHGQGL